MALTGRYDFKKTLIGKVVLQVEEEVQSLWSWGATVPSRSGGGMRP